MRYGSLSPLNLVLDSPHFIYERYDKSRYDLLRFGIFEDPTIQDVARLFIRYNIHTNTQLVSRDGSTVSLVGVSTMPQLRPPLTVSDESKLMIAKNKPEAFRFLVDQGGGMLRDQQ